jgi:hypothetical protein
MDGRNGFSVHERPPSTGSPLRLVVGAFCSWQQLRRGTTWLKSQQDWEKPKLANSGVYPDAQPATRRSNRAACTSELSLARWCFVP